MSKTGFALRVGVSLFAINGAAAFAQDTPAAGDQVDSTIVVTGIRASLEDAIRTKRNADAIVDAVSAEDIGKFPDRNIAESLQRVPGVVTNREFGEGERVALRGLAPNLTRTLVNGHAVATADWFVLEQLNATRNFNYLVMPSDIVGQLQVFKSPTADIEEGGIGGTVNVITRKPLDLAPLVGAISVEGAYTQKSDSFDPQVSGFLSWSNADQTFGVLVAGIYQRRKIRRDGFEILGYDSGLDPAGLGRQVPTLIGSAMFLQERERYGGNVEIQFRPSDTLEFGISGLWTRFGANNTNYNYLAWPARSGLGGGTTTLTDIQVEGDTIVAGRVNNVAAAGGFGQVYDVIDRRAFAETRYIAGNFAWGEEGSLRITGKAGYTDAKGDTVAQPFVEFLASSDFSFDLRGRAPTVSFATVNPTRPNDMAFEFASNHSISNDDNEFFAYLDAEQPLDLGPLQTIKLGLKYTDHNRLTDFQATTYGGFFLPFRASGCGGGVCTPSSFGSALVPANYARNIAIPGSLTSFFAPDPALIRNLIGAFPAATNRQSLYSDIYSVNEKTIGGYAMGKFGGDDWRGNVGVRVVHTRQRSSGYIQNATGPGQVTNDFGLFLPVTEERTYTDFLPSANLTFDLTSQVILRVAAGRTITRPDFTDIAPRVTLNPGSLTGTGGSADVQPYRANQFDLSLEYYPTGGGLFAAALYYKDVQNFVTDRISNEVFSIETSAPNLSRCVRTPGSANVNLWDCQFAINRRANGGTAQVKGLELIARTPIWGNFGVNANYSFSDASSASGDPIPGNSRHAFQAGGYYEDDLLSAQVSYNYRSDFFITFDRATRLNQKGFGSLDASLDVNLTRQISLTFDAVNLTNEKIVQYAGETYRPRAIYDNGRYFFFGARFKY